MPVDVPFGGLERVERRVQEQVIPSLEAIPVVVELGAAGWLGEVGDRLADGEDVVLDSDSAEAGLLAESLVAGATLYRDSDLDGVVGAEERELGRIVGLLPLE